MDLTPYIQIFILIPLIGFFISLVVKRGREKWLSAIAYYTAGIQLFLFLPFLVVAAGVTVYAFSRGFKRLRRGPAG